MDNVRYDFDFFKKIDAHSHIGFFGSPFNVNFNTELLARQMDEYNIEKTILCPAGSSSQRRSERRLARHAGARHSSLLGQCQPRTAGL